MTSDFLKRWESEHFELPVVIDEAHKSEFHVCLAQTKYVYILTVSDGVEIIEFFYMPKDKLKIGDALDVFDKYKRKHCG